MITVERARNSLRWAVRAFGHYLCAGSYKRWWQQIALNVRTPELSDYLLD